MSCEIKPTHHNHRPTNQQGTKRAGKAYMGQIPHDVENGQNVAFFNFFGGFAVTQRFDFFDFSLLL